MKLTRVTSALLLSTFSSAMLAASYSHQELPRETLGVYEFAASIDNTGLILTTLQDKFNLPIDASYLPLDNTTLTDNLTDLEAVRNGQFNDEDYAFLISSLRSSSRANSQFVQHLAQFVTYATMAGERNYVQAFDTQSEDLQGFSFSLDTVAIDSANGSHIVGNSEGPFRKLTYVNEAGDEVIYNLPEFDQRAFVQVGDTVSGLLPVDTTLGGVSRASAINQNYQVAGSASIGTTSGFQSAIETCDDETVRGDVPVESCYRNILFTSSSTGSVVRRSDLYINRATVWNVDNSGNVIDQQSYGLSFEPTEEQLLLSQFFSQALDINNNGVAVGSSTIIFNETRTSTSATKFENGEAIRLIEDDELLPNSAIGINDNDYIVGIRQQVVNGASREKMFIMAPDAAEPSFVTGFFESSATTPRAINNQNIVVGYADIEAGNTSTRRKAGFIYDIENDAFSDLNTLIACDVDFSIVEATDINDSGEIIASALAKRAQRDAQGQIVLDETGTEILVDTIVTIKLTPTGAAPSDCETAEEEEASILERQGASSGFLSVIGISIFLAFRRRLRRI